MTDPRDPGRDPDETAPTKSDPGRVQNHLGQGQVAKHPTVQAAEAREQDELESGQSPVPAFLTVVFVLVPLWAVWYFAFHLAPFMAPEPPAEFAARPADVAAYQDAQADPRADHNSTRLMPAGQLEAVSVTGPTSRLMTGAALFQGRCAQCHGPDGQGRADPLAAATLQGDSLLWTLAPNKVAQLVRYGFAGLMPQWEDDQNDASLSQVVGYLHDVMAPPPGSPSPLDITTSGVNAATPIDTHLAPWERADGTPLPGKAAPEGADSQSGGAAPAGPALPSSPNAPRVLWAALGQGWSGAGPVVAASGDVYLADAKGIASRVNPKTGQAAWRYYLGDRLLYTPAESGGTLYLARVGELAAVDANGVTLWSKKIDDSPVLSPAVGRNGTVYAAGGPLLYALTPGGKVLWQHKTDTFFSASPVLAADGTVYVGAKDTLLAFTGAGQFKWRYQDADTLYAAPALDASGNLYLGTSSGVVSLDPSGKRRWSHDGAPVQVTPVIGADGRVYAGDLGGTFWALGPDGKPAWSFQSVAGFSSPAALATDLVYAGSEDGRLHALGLDGVERWTITLDGPVSAAPTIGPDGRLYLGAGNHYYALATTSPPAKGPWPLSRQNAAGLGRQP